MSNVRVRIAPSPTGFLHIGTARTALFNWLFARQHGGAFILRIEDTDTQRSTDEFDHAIGDGLAWLGIDWDEGPDFAGVGAKGEFGPYRQSLRADIHRGEAQRLLDEGKAYKCFASREELDALGHNRKWRDATPEQVEAMGEAPYAIRFKVPEGVTVIDDLIQGTVRIENKEIDDFVIVKPNGDPIFHLAVVVDDGLMKISHVIRGDDHLSNTPRHVMLFEALGYAVPQFAHLPMVLTEGGKKMSKRDHGANLLDWRTEGYLPEAVLNYIAFLGWNPGDDRELFTRDELVEAFRLERVNKSGARFGLKRIQFLNGQHIRRLSAEDLRARLVAVLEEAGFDTSSKSEAWLTQLAEICREKIPTLNDIVRQADFFFVEPAEYEEKAVKKQWEKDDALERMRLIRETMESVDPWTHDALKAAYEAVAGAREMGLGKLVHPTRLALTGKSVGPGLFELAELLGKETCLARMDRG
ncbi:MAG: glutamate--tRNA ligase, partial [Candidatus Hydrogenedentes bacterium]|nr:glutamate--tRNA ligase [Candidatus Hydrogenedentota bacterium]